MIIAMLWADSVTSQACCDTPKASHSVIMIHLSPQEAKRRARKILDGTSSLRRRRQQLGRELLDHRAWGGMHGIRQSRGQDMMTRRTGSEGLVEACSGLGDEGEGL